MKSKKLISKALALVLSIVLTVGLLPIQASAATIRFVDVPDGQWYSEPINRLAEAGVVSGVGQNKFEPGRSVANAEMVKMLVNAFFRSEYEAYEAANSDAMWAHFGTKTYWFSFMCYYARETGLLDGVNVDIDDYGSCYTYMSRYDMAMVLYNAAAKKGVTVSADAKAVAKAELMSIGHYYDIPEQYRDVVVTVYASKLINGKGEQGFCGDDNMTRAEACTVLIRLEDLLKNGGGSTTDPDPGPSEPVVPTEKDIVVTTKTNATANNGSYGSTSGTAYSITDNGFPTGYLGNGKEINEANITELLEKAKTIWPSDTRWTDSGSNNNWYQSPGNVVTGALSRTATGATQNISAQYGCGGFAALISDYLFGKTANPYHRVTNFEDIRPGDIIVQLQTGNIARHVMIVTGINQTGSRAGYVFVAEGNLGNVIHWPGTSGWDAAGPDDLAAYGSYVILSRWPSYDPGKTPTQPATPTEKDIVVTPTPITNGTAWSIVDNGFATGYLNNGKVVTENNVKELLDKAKTIWPTGMTWAPRGTANNNSYNITGNASVTIPGIANTYECTGFAQMLSYYLFGKNANPVHTVTNFADIRPGDIIVSTTLNHTVIVIDKVETGEYAGAVFIAEGNYGKQVNWTDTTSNPKWNAWKADDFGTFTAYTRYPA